MNLDNLYIYKMATLHPPMLASVVTKMAGRMYGAAAVLLGELMDDPGV